MGGSAAELPYGEAVVLEDVLLHPKLGDKAGGEGKVSTVRPWLSRCGRIRLKPPLGYLGCERTRDQCPFAGLWQGDKQLVSELQFTPL